MISGLEGPIDSRIMVDFSDVKNFIDILIKERNFENNLDNDGQRWTTMDNKGQPIRNARCIYVAVSKAIKTSPFKLIAGLYQVMMMVMMGR